MMSVAAPWALPRRSPKTKRRVPDLQSPPNFANKKYLLSSRTKFIFNDLDLHRDPTLYEIGSVYNYTARLRFRPSVKLLAEMLDKIRIA
jgi:hypothetical protein